MQDASLRVSLGKKQSPGEALDGAKDTSMADLNVTLTRVSSQPPARARAEGTQP